MPVLLGVVGVVLAVLVWRAMRAEPLCPRCGCDLVITMYANADAADCRTCGWRGVL